MLKSTFEKIRNTVNQPIRDKHLKLGIPFFVFMALGVLILRECASIRYDFRRTRTLNREELSNLGYEVKEKQPTLEELYEEYKTVDLDNWENVRIPRFWEEQSSEK